jgi:D-alanine-D-alanine ligase|tara:strand:+ start:1573 stop:2526 length:954 start_codon:yes stop_codon:yes gene_type:complete
MERSKDRKIAVICGGPSAEAEVSRVSAAGVAEALQENYPHVTTLELDADLAQGLSDLDIDVVFPVLHGPPGEDGTLQGFLEIMQLAYVGSGVHASACGMDKIVSKHLFKSHNLNVADDVVLQRSNDIATGIELVTRSLGNYLVVKPSRQGSALGVHLVEDANQLHSAVRSAFQYDDRVLVEKRIDGKEITVGVLDVDDELRALPVIEIVTPEDSWYDFDHRYTEGLSEHILPARLTGQQNEALQQAAVAAHEALGCRHLSRADFVVAANGASYLLEVNTMPGMTPTSLYPDAAQGAGISFQELVSMLIESALAGHKR